MDQDDQPERADMDEFSFQETSPKRIYYLRCRHYGPKGFDFIFFGKKIKSKLYRLPVAFALCPKCFSEAVNSAQDPKYHDTGIEIAREAIRYKKYLLGVKRQNPHYNFHREIEHLRNNLTESI